jgi:hypothetical protein
MSSSESSTGSPPAVTFERLEEWREIATAIESALNMGGEPGMDLLVSRVAEWNEAVDEWTTGLQTCLELGSRGLRDEALQWHAEGFFDAGDNLHAPTCRDGWDAWQAALEEDVIPMPRFDLDLREAVRNLSAELRARDIAGRSLQEQIDGLRRNALIRGEMGERLTLLDSIRSLDEGREIWTSMIAPIRRLRAERVESEARAALAARDFSQLARRIEEVQNVDWEGQLPGTVVALMNAAAQLIRSKDAIHALSEAAAQLGMRSRELEGQPLNLPAFGTLLRAALQARQNYLAVRQQLTQSLQHAASVPETKAAAVALKLVEQGKQIDATAKPSLTWLGQQEQFEKMRLQFCAKEDDIQKLIAMAPSSGGSWEEFKQKAARWLDLESKVRIATNRLCSNSPDFVPPSTAARLAELGACQKAVKAARDRVVMNEKIVIGAVLGGLLLVVVVIVAVVVFSVARTPR